MIVLIIFSLFTFSEPKIQNSEMVPIKISDLQALIPKDNKVGDCLVTILPSKANPGGAEVKIDKQNPEIHMVKTYDPSDKRNPVQKFFRLRPINDKILNNPRRKHSLDFAEPHGAIRFSGYPKVHSENFEKTIEDLVFFYEHKTQKITHVRYINASWNALDGKTNNKGSFDCGQVGGEKKSEEVIEKHDAWISQ